MTKTAENYQDLARELDRLIPFLAKCWVIPGPADDTLRVMYGCRACETYGHSYSCDSRDVFEKHMEKHKANAEAGRPQERVR